ncbi:serine/threonine-protein kinase [Bradyrhizobium oligotrophicum]|uniref:serine/threonine-protein kinase n=1 Tax=Bradyrhizobium oligotrophicum TaxID=44255 RepID=UPI003EB6DC2D
MTNVLHKTEDVIGGRYKILGEVGQGGMQEVYAARDELLGRTVALKVPKSSSAEKRFKRSAVLSGRVNHANVAKTLDYLEENGRYYLIEELVTGCDLATLLADHIPSFDPYSVARALHHLAKGVAASHHVNVVHRDLKPNNVMVVGGAHVEAFKITDFGIAIMAEKEIGDAVEGGSAGLTASQTALGALPYMAPEMIEDLRSADKPTDIWSLGAMTLELMTGRRPFGQGYKAVPAIMEARLPSFPASMEKSPQFSSLGRELYSLVEKCMRKDPAERLTADELVLACERLCYTNAPREFGVVSSLKYNRYGYISSDDPEKPDVFYHVESVYGSESVSVGQKVWFSRYPGTPRARAFPVVLAK